ncbi:hypothetical protein [Evansella halocellulosilytica]|nr:hypothetical protein [Evansella halocellulosilytica]
MNQRKRFVSVSIETERPSDPLFVTKPGIPSGERTRVPLFAENGV